MFKDMVDLKDHTNAWISLDLVPNIGPVTVKRLLEIFKTPGNILAAPISEIKELGILNSAQIKSLAKGPDIDAAAKASDCLDKLGASVIGMGEPCYPQGLRHIEDPPVALYVKGSLEDLQPAVAIVGTRSPSHYGKDLAQRMARDLSISGVSVVSGLARGIDTCAHKGALEGISKTVGVLGSGLDTIYPPENTELAEKIAHNGAVITEFPPGTRPDAGNFPRRNRIISALSTAVVVIEAADRSGALITARLAGEQGKMVMAVPGAVTNIRSQGPHHLIRQGAVLVRDAQDVIMEIAPQIKGFIKDSEEACTTGDDIIDICAGHAMGIEDIAKELNIAVVKLMPRISMLELSGKIIKVDGNRFISRSTNG
ncbi:MAG TPA: DNA-protecting protein DprA [Deltaproteobacteria bacterium]|nr:DNA-protecting protein DprA [Deltaproteobacteria bacterium]